LQDLDVRCSWMKETPLTIIYSPKVNPYKQSDRTNKSNPKFQPGESSNQKAHSLPVHLCLMAPLPGNISQGDAGSRGISVALQTWKMSNYFHFTDCEKYLEESSKQFISSHEDSKESQILNLILPKSIDSLGRKVNKTTQFFVARVGSAIHALGLGLENFP